MHFETKELEIKLFYEMMHWGHVYCERNNENKVKEKMLPSFLTKKKERKEIHLHNPHTSDTEVYFCNVFLSLSQSNIKSVLHFSYLSSFV